MFLACAVLTREGPGIGLKLAEDACRPGKTVQASCVRAAHLGAEFSTSAQKNYEEGEKK